MSSFFSCFFSILFGAVSLTVLVIFFFSPSLLKPFFSVRFLPLPCAVGIACMATCQVSFLFVFFFLYDFVFPFLKESLSVAA